MILGIANLLIPSKDELRTPNRSNTGSELAL
jgi:hypothetical protein